MKEQLVTSKSCFFNHPTEHSLPGTNRLRTKMTVHHIDWAHRPWRKLGTKETVHRIDCALPAEHDSTANECNSAPSQLNTSTTVH